jgi:hypothetical protein
VASNNVVDGGGQDSVPNIGLYLLASNEGGTTAAYYPGRISFAAMSAGLTAADSLALYNAVQALRTALGGGMV